MTNLHPKLVPILFCLVLGLAVYSVLVAPIFQYSSTDWGLLSKLPISYWMAFAAMVFSVFYIILRNAFNFRNIVFLLLMIFVLLYFAPILIERPVGLTPRSLWPSSEVNILIATGHISSDSAMQLLSYDSWPVFNMLGATIIMVTGISLESLAKYFPLFIVGLWGLLVFLVLRVSLHREYALIGTALFMTGLWARLQYFSPQSIALAFFLVFVLLFVKKLFYQESKISSQTRRTQVIIFLIIVVTVFAHALTALFMILIMGAFYLITKILPAFRNDLRQHTIAITVGICTFLLFAHAIFFAPQFFGWVTQEMYHTAQNLLELSVYQQGLRISGSMYRQWTNILTEALILINILVWLIAVGHTYRKKTMSRYQLTFWVSFAIVLIVPSLILPYGQEAPFRAFTFALLDFSLLSVLLLKKKLRILLALILVLVVLSLPTMYGTETFKLATATELSGTGFTMAYSPEGARILYHDESYLRYHDPLKDIQLVTLGTPPFNVKLEPSVVDETIGEADYVILSQTQENFYVFNTGSNPLSETKMTNLTSFNKIYSNDGFQLFCRVDAFHMNTP